MADDDIVFEVPPAARGGVSRTDWGAHLEPLRQHPRRCARVKVFREFSYPPQLGPDGKPLKDPETKKVILDKTKDKVFDQKKSNSRAATLASGIRDANLGKPGSLRLPEGEWDAVSRSNGVWAVYYPKGEAYVSLSDQAKADEEDQKAEEAMAAEAVRQVPPDAPADHAPVAPHPEAQAHVPEPAWRPESALQGDPESEARAAFAEEGSEEAEW